MSDEQKRMAADYLQLVKKTAMMAIELDVTLDEHSNMCAEMYAIGSSQFVVPGTECDECRDIGIEIYTAEGKPDNHVGHFCHSCGGKRWVPKASASHLRIVK